MAVPDIDGALAGIDVSHWQNPGDWSPDRIRFVIARASIGTQPDDKYDRHIAKARKAGLVTGAYHFNVGSGLSVADQVRAFLAAAGDVDLLALDVEGKDPFSLKQAREFITRVQATGRSIGLYMSASGFLDAGQDWDWVALWGTSGTPPKRHWDLWQYGPRKGIDGDLAKSQRVLDAITGKGDSMSVYEIVSRTGTAEAPPGASILKLTDDGFVKERDLANSRSFRFDALLNRISGTGPGHALRISSGTLAGLYVNTGSVVETYDPVQPPLTQADIDAATAPLQAQIADLQEELSDATSNATDAEKTRLRQLLGL